MSRQRFLKTNFTAGEISRRLLGRADLRAYDNGALKLRNVLIHPTGGISRRPGLAFCAVARGAGRLVAFEFNTDQTYLLAFHDRMIDVIQGDSLITSLTAPWTLAQVEQITWTQSADTLLICHPDVAPRKLTRTGASAWSLNDWAWFTENDVVRQPYYRFGDTAVTLQPSGTSGAISITASSPVFQTGHDGARMRIGGKQVLVTGVVSPTQINATVKETLAGTTATTVWDEAAFSPVRGWPVSAAFHQDRLVIGGSRDLPNRLWLSRSADLWNFDPGTGLDDHAIEFGILSDQVNAIRAVVSARHLLVFTSGAEWMVTGDPLTPTSIQLNRQTRIGSPTDRTVPPRDVDGATVFIARNGLEVREFVYTDTEAAYQANDLAVLARHLVNAPRDQDYDQTRRLLLVVMADGTLGALTFYRVEEVKAWTRFETDGRFTSVAVAGDTVYVLVERSNNRWTIERFDDALTLDAALAGTHATAASTWSGLDHLNGRTVTVVADGEIRTPALVTLGAIPITPAALAVQAGLPFTHTIEPLPPNPLTYPGGDGSSLRLVDVTFRLDDTAALRVDVGRGLQDLPLHQFGAAVAGAAGPRISGDRRLKAFGWRRDLTLPLWRIEQDQPLPFTLLSVSMDIRIND